MTAKLLCVCASVLGAAVGACLPVSPESESQDNEAPSNVAVAPVASSAPVPDVPLEIAINQFPSGYQGRWATNAAACADDPEHSTEIMSLQGKLVKFHESVGTMTEGKRTTSKTMQAAFAFVGEGEKWSKSMAFALSENRKRLALTDMDDGASYQYVQCPKLMAG